MNENIKAMCLELAELALETNHMSLDIRCHGIIVQHYKFVNKKVDVVFFDNIHFIERDAEGRIKKALDYVRDLGGNKDV